MALGAQHSCLTDQWFTPDHVLNMVRNVLGNIDLDPASSEIANDRVRASRYFDKCTDGLLQPWVASTVFINPPGGKTHAHRSLPTAFWKKLMNEIGNIGHAIFVAYSIEQLKTSQGKGCRSIMDFPFCIPLKRLDFHSLRDKHSGPAHSNVIAYVPGQIDKTDLFKSTFEELGAVK